MAAKIGIVHTFLYSVEDIKAQFQKQLPGVQMVNIIDDSLLEEALQNKGLTPHIIARMCAYYRHCEQLGCDAVLNQCSSVGEAADIAAKLINIPVYKIDAPMARQAVQMGSKIAVIATAISTVEPSSRLVESMGRQAGKTVQVQRCYCEGAYEALLKENDREKHNRIVIEQIEKAAQTNDVIVLAQGSMYQLLELTKHIDKPILTSLESGIAQLKELVR